MYNSFVHVCSTCDDKLVLNPTSWLAFALVYGPVDALALGAAVVGLATDGTVLSNCKLVHVGPTVPDNAS